VVTTPSRVAAETVKKLLVLLEELRLPILGILENMSRPRLHRAATSVHGETALR
jgi:Mrp family chromosome partitioning ATPase